MTADELSAIAEIDLSYYMLQDMANEKPSTGINAMIDEATGYAKAKAIEKTETAIHFLKIIVEKKEFLGYDATGDRKALDAARELLTKQSA